MLVTMTDKDITQVRRVFPPFWEISSDAGNHVQ